MSIKKFLPLIGILILIFLIYSIGLNKIVLAFLRVNPFYIVFYLVLFVPLLFLQAFKWFYLMEKQGLKVKFFDAFKLNIIGVFFSFITPGKIGSLIKIFYFKENTGKSSYKSFSSVLIDKFMDLASVFFIAFLGTIFLSKIFYGLFFVVLLLIMCFALLFYILFSKKRTRFFLGWIYRFLLPKNLKKLGKKSFNAFYERLPKKRFILVNFILSLVAWLLIYFQGFVMAKAFGVKISFFEFISIDSIATIVSLIPVTISGLGTKELTLVGLFSFFNVPAENVVLFSLTAFVLSVALFSFLGWIFCLKKYSLKESVK